MLDSVEELRLDQWWMDTVVLNVLVDHLAEVVAIREHAV